MPQALLIRLDKIGDLVLTLPADQQRTLAKYNCHWVIAPGMGFIAEHAVPSRSFTEMDRDFSWKNLKTFWRIVRHIKPEVSISFQAPWWINMVLALSGIPQRIGVLSKWHSFLFLNYGVRQKRSQSTNHELEYNQQLVHLGLQDPQPITYSTLTLRADSSITLPEVPPDFVVVHPGMAGSARNWSTEKYAALIKKLSPHIAVIVTGTPADRPYTEPLMSTLSTQNNIFWLQEKLNIRQLLLLLSKAQHVVAPSTGVLHLAASLQTPVTGIYSPVRVQRDTRWGPKGIYTKTVTPQVDCPAQFACLGDKCSVFDCMELVSVEQIYQTIGARTRTRPTTN
ncbi:MAG: glycosyltransferase family 9 protein [Bdellovibrionaceae bacterium]|nr:glycosyltransferase family 9 protein [Pseudobdellovibrionaceae bacterium]